MQWFKVKEKSAGKLRLKLTWQIYKILGKNYVKIIAYFVSLFTLLFNKDLREYSSKYFQILYNFTKKNNLKPSILNTFKQCLNYSYALVDKIGVFGKKFDYRDIGFENIEEKNELFNNIKENGVFFICNHIGNIEVLRSLLSSEEYNVASVSIFLQRNQCRIFNDFVESLNIKDEKIKIYPIEEIDISDSIEVEKKLKSGGVVFMAGDRISATNDDKITEMPFLNSTIVLPDGVFKFAKMYETNVYFISCISENDKYKVYLKKTNKKNKDTLQKEFIIFLEKMVNIAPFQFYNFCDYFLPEKISPDK